MSTETSILRIEDLSVATATGRVLLHIPHLEIAAGTRLGLQGPSGAGKSTLIQAIAGLVEGARGKVFWDGTDILALRPGARCDFRRARMGIVFQEFHVFEEMTAGENAAIAALFSPRHVRPVIRQGADRALDNLAIKDPDQGISTMSGGERQRIAVARALAHQPGILLADEPTANLQREAGDALAADLTAEEHTLIVASHDANLLTRMDRVLTLSDGEIIADA